MNTNSLPNYSTGLEDRAMLVYLKISSWGGETTDRKAMEAVAAEYEVPQSIGKVVKELIDPSLLKPIKTMGAALSAIHKKHTLPWADTGERILLSANFFRYRTEINDAIAKRQEAVDAFVDRYEQGILDQKARLKTLFHPEDYPSDIKERFEVKVQFNPKPIAADFRVEMDESTKRAIQEQIADRDRQLLAAAHREVWDRLYTPLQRVVDTLSKGDDARIYDTMLGNVQEIVDILPGINITGDVHLEAMAREIKSRLLSYSTDSLRDHKTLRPGARAEAEALMARMAEYMPGNFNQTPSADQAA